MISDEKRAALHLCFIRAGRHMGRGMRELGVSPGEARVIRAIHMHGDKNSMNPSEISEALSVRQPTLTPILDSLEQKGYITRVRDESDRRKVCIALTNKCLEDVHSNLGRGKQLLSRLDEFLTTEEIEQLTSIMKKIDNYIRDEWQEKKGGKLHEHNRPLP